MFWKRPAEQPFGFLGAHVDAAMAHRHAEVLMPVRAMEGMSLGREETRPGNAGEFIIIRICKEISIAHMLGRILFENTEITLRRFGESPSHGHSEFRKKWSF